MSVRAKTGAALLAVTALADCAFAQTDVPAGPFAFNYTETSSELLPQWDAAPSSLQGIRVQTVRWTQVGDNAFGLALGMSLEPGVRGDSYARLQPGVGLRWRSNLGNRQRLDVATWRSLQERRDDAAAQFDGYDTAPLITTRIEMQFVPPKGSGFGAELGAIGLQLSSDSKLQLKIRRGGPVVYYRSKF
jgi:hypothetical protein